MRRDRYCIFWLRAMWRMASSITGAWSQALTMAIYLALCHTYYYFSCTLLILNDFENL